MRLRADQILHLEFNGRSHEFQMPAGGFGKFFFTIDTCQCRRVFALFVVAHAAVVVRPEILAGQFFKLLQIRQCHIVLFQSERQHGCIKRHLCIVAAFAKTQIQHVQSITRTISVVVEIGQSPDDIPVCTIKPEGTREAAFCFAIVVLRCKVIARAKKVASL